MKVTDRKRVLMWVSPEYKTRCKMEATRVGKTLLEWSKEKALDDDPLKRLSKEYKTRKRNYFDFV